MRKTLYNFFVPLSGSRYFLFNTLIFDYVVLDEDSFICWEDNQLECLDYSVYKMLCEAMLIVDDDDDNCLLEKAFKLFSDRSSLPPSFAIYVTNKCNLRCKFCFAGYELEKSYSKLTFQNVDKIFLAIDEILSCSNVSRAPPVVAIFGGEPLLPMNKAVVEKIFRELKTKNFIVEVVSNIIYAKDFYDVFTDYGRDLHFKVTFVGSKMYHNEIRCDIKKTDIYTQQILNISDLLTNVPNSNVNISILLDKNNSNIKNISSLINDLINSGILLHSRVDLAFGLIQFRTPYLGCDYKDSILSADNYYPALLDIIDNIHFLSDIYLSGSPFHLFANLYHYWFYGELLAPCLSGCDAVSPGRYCFYPDGNIYPCFDAVGIESMAIAQFTPDLCFNTEETKWRNFKLKTTKCVACKFIAICNGGCLITNFFKNNKIDDPHCLSVDSALTKFITYLDKKGKFDEKH